MAAVALLVGAAGCMGPPSQVAVDEVSLEPSPHIEGAYKLPLEPYLFPDEHIERTIFEALERAVQACMAERGFEYVPAEFSPDRPPDIYGLLSVERARQFGYRPPVAEAPADSTPELSEEAFTALVGERSEYITARTSSGRAVREYAPDSCSGKVTDRLQPDWPDLVHVQAKLEAISEEALRILYEVEQPTQAWAAWSACMADAGYEFDDPWAPYESLWAGSEPRQEEIDTAVADATCKKTTDVLAGWSVELAHVQSELLQQNPGVIDEWLDMRHEHLRLAEKFLEKVDA